MGYPNGQKGYRFFDMKEKKIITTRDVRFVEDVFPFKTVFPTEFSDLLESDFMNSQDKDNTINNQIMEEDEITTNLDQNGTEGSYHTEPKEETQNMSETQPVDTSVTTKNETNLPNAERRRNQTRVASKRLENLQLNYRHL